MGLAEVLAGQSRIQKILTLDIETSPALAYVWGLFDERISPSQVVEPARLLCFAAKWLDRSSVLFYSEHEHDREEMVRAAWSLLNEADVVVGYNSKRFDIPHLQREFVSVGLGPPSRYHHVDLYQVGKQFRWLSHKLDYVTGQLGLDRKLQHSGLSLWLDVLAGDVRAWRTFKRYNKQDVVITEQLFRVLRPWAKLPHVGLWSGDLTCCAVCGSSQLSPDGIDRMSSGAYLRVVCDKGHFCRMLASGQTRRT